VSVQLEDVLARKEAALAALQKEGEQAKGTKARGPDFQPDQVLALQQEVAQLRAENQQLQAQLQERGRHANGYPSPEQGENRQERPGSGRGGWGASSSWRVDQRAKGGGWIEEVVALQRRAELAEMSRDLAQRQCIEAIEKAAVLRLQHQQTVARLQVRPSRPRALVCAGRLAERDGSQSGATKCWQTFPLPCNYRLRSIAFSFRTKYSLALSVEPAGSCSIPLIVEVAHGGFELCMETRLPLWQTPKTMFDSLKQP
jgi:hypothetical protein